MRSIRWRCPAPRVRAASTYSRCLRLSTWLRLTRANVTQLEIASTKMTLTTLGPSTAAMKMASRIDGNVSWMSASRISTESLQPPKYPASIPIVTPSNPARTSVAPPTTQ